MSTMTSSNEKLPARNEKLVAPLSRTIFVISGGASLKLVWPYYSPCAFRRDGFYSALISQLDAL